MKQNDDDLNEMHIADAGGNPQCKKLSSDGQMAGRSESEVDRQNKIQYE